MSYVGEKVGSSVWELKRQASIGASLIVVAARGRAQFRTSSDMRFGTRKLNISAWLLTAFTVYRAVYRVRRCGQALSRMGLQCITLCRWGIVRNKVCVAAALEDNGKPAAEGGSKMPRLRLGLRFSQPASRLPTTSDAAQRYMENSRRACQSGKPGGQRLAYDPVRGHRASCHQSAFTPNRL